MTGAVIAVDGPAGSGKSTIARAVAARLAAKHVDTGAMYRALALKVLEAGGDPSDLELAGRLLDTTDIEVGDGAVLLDGRDVASLIRTAEVTAASSRIAEIGAVRRWMVDRQRTIARGAGGAVVEGRDIGTVVLPDADLKIYLTATESERIRRRSAQTGGEAGKIAREIAQRDARDTQRELSPLLAAHDAVVLDTTDLSIDQVVDRVMEILESRRVTHD